MNDTSKWGYLKVEFEQAHADYLHYDEKIKSQINIMLGSWVVFVSVLALILNLKLNDILSSTTPISFSLNNGVLLYTAITSIALLSILMINYFLITDLKKSALAMVGSYNAIIEIKKQMYSEKPSIYKMNVPSLLLSEFSWIPRIAFPVCTVLLMGLAFLCFLISLINYSVYDLCFAMLSAGLYLLSLVVLADYIILDYEIKDIINGTYPKNKKSLVKGLIKILEMIFEKKNIVLIQFLTILFLLAVIFKLLFFN